MKENSFTLQGKMIHYRHLKYVFLIAFNVALFYMLYIWVLKNIELYTFVHDMEQVSLLSMLVGFVLISADMVLYGVRLSVLLRVPFHQGFAITCIGYGVNNIAPFRLGELYRIYYANQQYQLSNSRVLAGTVIERYLDFMMLLVLGVMLIFLEPRSVSQRIEYIFAGLVVCGVLSVLLYRALHAHNSRLKLFLSRWRVVKVFIEAITQVYGSSSKIRLLLLSTIIWVGLIVLYYAFFALNLPNYSIGLGGAIFLCFATTLLFAIPYTIAGLGAFESATLFYLIHYLHIDYSRALALAVAFHFAIGLPQVIWMVVVYVIDKIGVLRLTKRVRVKQ